MRTFRPFVLEAGFLIALSLAAGGVRRFFPQSIAWSGRWPTSSTSAEEAYKMMARPGDPGFISLAEVIPVVEHRSATLLDARAKDEYAAGHLPHALPLPFYEMESYAASSLKGLKADAPLVIYCEGIGCELSFFLGRELMGQGFTDVKIFYGGYPEWKDAGLPVEK